MTTATLTFVGTEDDNIRMERCAVWIGDPCYVPVLSKNWDDFLTAYWSVENGCCSGVVVNGHTMVLGGTAHGDGCYDVEGGTASSSSLGVDAGLLCVIPEVLFEDLGLKLGRKDYGGAFVEDVMGDCHVDENHSLCAGHIMVHTQEMCSSCKEPRDSGCHCARCERCDEVEQWDCYCDKCYGCDEFSDECTCDRCEHCEDTDCDGECQEEDE